MPNWKKLLSSGSSGSLSNLIVDNHISASLISGSFYGDGSGLTGIIADGTISGSSQVNITQTEGYSTFSSSIQTYSDAKTTALSSSVDAHLDANISSLSSSAHTQREAIKGLATTANNSLSSSIATALRGEYVAADTALSSSQKTYIDQKVAGVVDSAPATLDTLNELAAALNDDPNFSASIATSIGNRVLTSTFNTYSGSAAGALRTEYKAGDSALSSSAHTQRVAIASSIPTNNNQLTNGAGYITGHPSISAASSVDNSGRTYIQDITLDSNGHVTGIASATETVTNTDTNYYLDGITKSGNTLTFSVNGTTNQSYAFGSNAFTSTTIPTNNNQLTNGAGYITSFDITTQTDSKYLRSDTSDIMAGVLTLNSTNDNQLILTSANTWTGIGFNDGDAASTDYLWHYGATGTFALGGGGSSVSGKKLHVDGGVTIGSTSDATTPPTDGLYVQTQINLAGTGTIGTPGAVTELNANALQFGGNNNAYETNSAQISAGLHQADSLNLVGMGTTSSNRRIDTWNEGGFYTRGTFYSTGDIVAYSSSDRELKDNLIPIGNATEKVKQLTGYEFDWNDKQDVYEGHDIGVVAQEVEKVLPELVTTRDNGYKAVKYEKLVALLIQSNKELIERVEALEKQLNAK